MTTTYIQDELEDDGFNYIEKLIPNRLIEGTNHGKPVRNGIQWDLETDAAGLEGQLEELKLRWNDYLEQRWLAINESQSLAEPSISIIDDASKPVTNRTYIFNNSEALKQVRWQYFLSDIHPMIIENGHLDKLIDSEIHKGREFLDNTYRDVMQNFDSKLIKFKQKRKVIVPSSFFDSFDGVDE